MALLADCLNKLWYFISLVLYVADVCTDAFATYKHYTNCDPVWASMTLLFTILPIINVAIIQHYHVFQYREFSLLGRCFRVREDRKVSVMKKCFLLLVTICLMPVLPFITLVFGAVASNAAADGYGKTTIIQATLESLPQAAVQAYIIAQTLHRGSAVDEWLWISVVISIMNFTFTISFNIHRLFEKATSISRAIFFFCGLIAISSRLFVCCLFSIIMKPLWLLPSGTIFVASVIVWYMKRSGKYDNVPLGYYPHRTCHIIPIVFVIITWMLTSFYNNFTRSGLPASFLTLAFAISASLLQVPQVAAIVDVTLPQDVAIVGVTFAGVSLIINIILTVVSKFRRVEKHWLNIDQEGESYFY